MDRTFQEKTGLIYVFDLLELGTPFGRELLKNAEFYSDAEGLREELSRVKIVREAGIRSAFISDLERNFAILKDIRGSIGRLEDGTRLSMEELYELKIFLIAMENIGKIYNENLSLPGVEFKDLAGALDIIDPRGERKFTFAISDSASEKLSDIRKKKRNIEKNMKSADSGWRIEWDKVCLEEDGEEKKICLELTEKLRPFATDMDNNAMAAGRLDFVIAKASLADTVLPEICGSDRDVIEFTDMVNPELAAILKTAGRRFVPVSFSAGKGATVITGANMGGKSVAVKTFVLNCVLAMLGFPVYAGRAGLPVINGLAFVTEAGEDYKKGMSSFAGEMAEIGGSINELKTGGLLVLDEPSRGTNPEEGAAIVKALVEYAGGKDAFSVVITHFDEVASLAGAHYRIKDFSLRQCSPDEPVPREAIDTLENLGIDKELVNLARKYMQRP